MNVTPKLMNCAPMLSVDDLPGDIGDYVMEPKLDGYRLSARIHGSGVEFMSRSQKTQDGKLPHLESELRGIFPPGTILDGELCILEQRDGRYYNDFEHVASVMNSLAKRSVQVQTDSGRWLQFIVFDVIAMDGDDLRGEPLEKRRFLVNSAIKLSGAKYTQSIPTFSVSQEQHETMIELGFEGTVVKKLDSLYHSGRRGYGWYKWKSQPTVDVVILGEGKPGEGRNAGKVGSISFGQPLDGSPFDENPEQKATPAVQTVDGTVYVVRGQAAGIDDAERDYVTEHMDELVGTVMEVAHMGIYPNKITMRHPQFKRFRDDKPASEVTWHDS